MRFSYVATLFLATLVTWNQTLIAQTATGEVTGTLTDPLGAIVPEASVKLINQATGIETSRSTSESGGYLFVNVQPGVYHLRVAKAGFKETEISSFTVGVNQAVRLNVKLDVGAVVERMEVMAEASLVQATTTELEATEAAIVTSSFEYITACRASP